MNLIPIKKYRDFWDFPRIFLVTLNNDLLLFDCKFDEKKEDYEDTYEVFVMPKLTEKELSGSWHNLSEKSVRYLGKIETGKVKFDETHRQFIDGDGISEKFSF